MHAFFEILPSPAAHVLMPVYNSASFIIPSLESVFKQNYANILLIIANDGSTDASMSVIEDYLSINPQYRTKISIENSLDNHGIALTRKVLLKKSKILNPNAYIFWLDADDIYLEDSVIQSVMVQMIKTKADICALNFSIAYEDPSQIANAAGLIEDRENSQRVLEQIYTSPARAVSPLDVDIMNLTSLGWIKCYAPTVQLPESADCPFEDFVFMAALLSARVITAIDPQKLPIQYLRRSTSVCGQRTPENFIVHIPTQMRCFFEAVLVATTEDEHQIEKLKKAEQFTHYKFKQYANVLKNLVKSRAHEDIQEIVLQTYSEAAENVCKFVSENMRKIESELLKEERISNAITMI